MRAHFLCPHTYTHTHTWLDADDEGFGLVGDLALAASRHQPLTRHRELLGAPENDREASAHTCNRVHSREGVVTAQAVAVCADKGGGEGGTK